MAKLFNLARMTSATTGTGTLTLGSAVGGFLSFSGAGVSDGDKVLYGIKDGTASEAGYGTYAAAGTTLSRDKVLASTNSGSAINCSGSQEIFICCLAESFGDPPAAGRLAYVSATQIKLSPYNGGRLKIAGIWYDIPSGGVTGANTSTFINGTGSSNLSASTLYYAYLFNNGGTLTIDFSTTGHATSATAGNVGTEIKSGDDSRTLIGMVYTNASNQFDDSATKRNVVSWFNRVRRRGRNVFTAQRSTSSATWVELSSEIRIEFVVWPDELVLSTINPSIVLNSSAAYIYQAVGFDGATNEDYNAMFYAAGATSTVNMTLPYSGVKDGLSEGHHYVTVLGQTQTGTATWGDSTVKTSLMCAIG